jgi:hypothetical protein
MKKNKLILDKLLSESQKAAHILFGNGYLFHGKKEVGRIKPKHLRMIRQKVEGVALPDLETNMNYHADECTALHCILNF